MDAKIFFLLALFPSVLGLEAVNVTPYSADIIWHGGTLDYYRAGEYIDSEVSDSNFTLTGLSGGTEYTITSGSESASFTTGTSDIMIGPDFEIIKDGEPFFPIMQWLQAKSRISYQSGLGINVFMGQGNGETPQEYLDECQANHVYGIVDFDENVIDHQALFGWMWVDEPDLDDGTDARRYPSEVLAEYKRIKSYDANHPFVLTLTANFFSRFSARDWMGGTKDWYYDYMNTADILGFDYYMIYGWCKPEWISEIADSQDEFLEYGNKTTFQWIEAAKTSSKWCDNAEREPDDGPYPEEMRNEVWQAIVHGAKAIGYFTHSWECPGYTQWCLSAEQEAELKRTNRQVTDLAPAILSDEISYHKDDVDYMKTVYDDTVYIFAVNKERTVKTASFDAASASAVEVYNESRTIDVQSGEFSDEFESLGVHIYILRGDRCTKADANFDNAVSILELQGFINKWRAGEENIADLMEVIGGWKHGC